LRNSLLLRACAEQFDFPPRRRQWKGFYRLTHRELVDRLEQDQQVSLIDGNTGKTPGTAAFFFWCGAAEYDSSYV
jgi:hypothetical protein